MEKRVKIWNDTHPCNPFTEWDCEPGVIFRSGRNDRTEWSNEDLVRYIANFSTYNQLVRHQRTMIEILGLDPSWYKEMDVDTRIDNIRDEILDATLEGLSRVCELFKIPHSLHTSTGYSQGDWAEVLIVLTYEFFTRTGRAVNRSEEILEGTRNLFDNYVWGDVYGFTIEKKVEYIRMLKEDYLAGNFTENEEDFEWVVEDSCGGFYGHDWNTNGMKDYVPKELWDQLDAAEVEY